MSKQNEKLLPNTTIKNGISIEMSVKLIPSDEATPAQNHAAEKMRMLLNSWLSEIEIDIKAR